jgi:hypothetical protein
MPEPLSPLVRLLYEIALRSMERQARERTERRRTMRLVPAKPPRKDEAA